MFYLLLAVCSSASIALLFKVAARVGASGNVITTVNYLTAALCSGAMVLYQGPDLFLPDLSAFLGSLGGKTPEGSMALAIWLGCFTGGLYLISFISYQRAIHQSGASLAGMFSKLGILLPMLVSVVAWKEYPTPMKWVGILLALGSIVLCNLGGERKGGGMLWLLLTFLFSGLAEFMTKIYERYGLSDYQNHFLLVIFLVALLLSLRTLVQKRPRWDKFSVFLGVCIGVPNLLCPFFLLRALAALPAAVVFPVYSAGSVAVILLGSLLFFREKLKKTEQAAALLTLCAMVLINL